MISSKIKELRAEKNISQKELASQLFISPQAISKWERNESTPNPEAIAKMAEIFGVSADYLVGRTDQKEQPPAQGEGLDPGDMAHWYKAMDKMSPETLQQLIIRATEKLMKNQK